MKKWISKVLFFLSAMAFLGSVLAHSKDGDPVKSSLESEPEISVDGAYLKAFEVAYKAFLRESQIPKNKKEISNYAVIFSQTGDTLNVVFDSKLAQGEDPYTGGEGKLGKDVEYQIDRKSYKIFRRLFFK